MNSLVLVILFHFSFSSELYKFHDFLKVLDKSQFSRFKSNFFNVLNDLFNNSIHYTEDIPEKINPLTAFTLMVKTENHDNPLAIKFLVA